MSSSPKSKNLSYEQVSRSLMLHRVIKEFKNYFPEEFKKTDIKECPNCKGTGLFDFTHITTNEVCGWCKGVGYLEFEFLETGYVCKHCNGVGCKSCSDNGFVDWIRNAMKLVVNK